MDREYFNYEYKNAHFKIRKNYGYRNVYYTLEEIIDADVEDLYIPDTYNGNDLDSEMSFCKHSHGRYSYCDNIIFSKVKRLYIPLKVRQIHANNEIFPNLEKIIIDPKNTELSAVGPMLISKGELIFVFSAGMAEECHLPSEVTSIGPYAFSDTKCKKITSENPEIQVNRYAFDNSMIKNSTDMLIIGNTFVSYQGKSHEIVIPEHITSICDFAFEHICPVERIQLSQMLLKPKIGELPQTVKSICLTKHTGKLNFNTLREFEKLESITFPDNSIYKIVDDVIFSKDGKILIYCPPCLKMTYIIPEGTESIAAFAFKDNQTLTQVELPRSLKNLGAGAFYGCRVLESVQFSESLLSIPGATDFFPYGVFENCSKLTSVDFPNGLRMIGSYAFANTGLTNIVIPEGVEFIGEYAFASYNNYEAPILKNCRLPSTLFGLGRGALAGAKNVSVYEGTAKGLISAIEAKLPDRKVYSSLLIWTASLITIQGKIEKKVYIPESAPLISRSLFEQAWNQEEFDFELYRECFECLSSSDEKQLIAFNMLNIEKVDKSFYITYLRRVASKIYSNLINCGKEQELIQLVQIADLSVPVLRKILKAANNANMTVLGAYILQAIQDSDKPKRGLRL